MITTLPKNVSRAAPSATARRGFARAPVVMPEAMPSPSLPRTTIGGDKAAPAGSYRVSISATASAAATVRPAAGTPTGGVPANPPAGTPAARSGWSTGSGPVSVDVMASDSGYDNKIYWSTDNFATRHLLGVDNRTGTVELGTFAPGTRIDFGIVNGVGDFYRTGSASVNKDGFEHAQSTQTAQGLQIGFEDLAGGGDKDFNDAVIRVRGLSSGPVPQPPGPVAPPRPDSGGVNPTIDDRGGPGPKASGAGATPVTKGDDGAKKAAEAAKKDAEAVVKQLEAEAEAAKKASEKAQKKAKSDAEAAAKQAKASGHNRSGLGDGSNPGQGDGRTNSPNTGTANPSRSTSTGATATKNDPEVARHRRTDAEAAKRAAEEALKKAKGDAEVAVRQAKFKAKSAPAPAPAPAPINAAVEKNKQMLRAMYAAPAGGEFEPAPATAASKDSKAQTVK